MRGRPRGPQKKSVSYRLTPEALTLLATLSERYGLNHSDMLEVVIRDKARQDHLWTPAQSKDQQA